MKMIRRSRNYNKPINENDEEDVVVTKAQEDPVVIFIFKLSYNPLINMFFS
jgi:hypothetical protein